jgi:hypothetical protein
VNEEVLRIRPKGYFRLPALGKKTFSDLMRAGLSYSSGQGFSIRPGADLEVVRKAIEKATKKKVFYVFNCVICGKEMDCSTCIYSSVCPVETTNGYCICDECLSRRTLDDYFQATRRFFS